MTGIRAKIGQLHVGNAISQFQNVCRNLEEGIKHFDADISSHKENISESNKKIVDLNSNKEKANRILNKVKNIIE